MSVLTKIADAPHPDFHAIYLDSNMLKGEGWPNTSIALHNLFRLATWWGIKVFLPQPVLRETFEHWLRGVKDGVSGLQSAKRSLQRFAGPAKCEINVEHTPIEKIIEEYRKKVDDRMKEYSLVTSGYTLLSTEDIFGFATKYLMPFVTDGKGKGFQDAVILLSVLDHLNTYSSAKGILITADPAFKKAQFTDFFPGFDQNRLAIVDSIRAANELLWAPYFDETVLKPYRREIQNSKVAANKLIPELTEFLKRHLTPDMLKPGLGDTVLKLMSVDRIEVRFVETPLPEPDKELNRTVSVLIKVSVECTVFVSRDLAYLMPMFGKLYGKSPDEVDIAPLPEELETQLTWDGGISATADIVDGEFTNIIPKALVPEKQ